MEDLDSLAGHMKFHGAAQSIVWKLYRVAGKCQTSMPFGHCKRSSLNLS